MKEIHDGDRVRVLLGQCGMTQKELADKIGISESTLSRMLNESSWRTDYLRFAGEALGMNFFEPYCPVEKDGGPVLGILLKPDCLNDPEIIRKAKDQLSRN